MKKPQWIFYGVCVVLLAVTALIASCTVQDYKAPLKVELEKTQAGLAEIKLDSNITIFGTPRGVFTAKNTAICIDALTPGDVVPLVLRLKDPNTALPPGLSEEIHTESKIPVIAPSQQNQTNVNINVPR